MTELEYKIQTIESAIRTVSRSIARSKKQPAKGRRHGDAGKAAKGVGGA